MLEQKLERIRTLLKALDDADGKEDFIIHRDPALTYVRTALYQIESGQAVLPTDPTKAELLMALNSLTVSPLSFKRRSEHEVLKILLETQSSASKQAGSHPH
jgi:hypothetical protein